MYLDTKNFAAIPQTGSSLDISAAAITPLIPAPAKAKSGKLRKVWKRLIKLKSGGTTSSKGSSPSSSSSSSSNSTTPPAHPNNVSLNNQYNTSPPTVCHNLPKELSIDLATRSFEKLTLSATDSPAGRCSAEELQAVISSASIEKTPVTSSCIGCGHGRNCTRHTLSGEELSAMAEQQNRNEICPQQEMLQLRAEAQALIQYLSTDDGTFFWPSDELQHIDDDLLHELLCQSFRQFPDAMTALRC